MPVFVASVRQFKAIRRVVAVVSVGAILLSLLGISWANRDAAQAAAFAAAPACPPATVPVGNCAGWEQETVSGVEPGRGGTEIRLSAGGQTLEYTGGTWAAGLTAGTSVSVLVWRDEAQALRDPAGEVVYSNNSVRLRRYADINIAVFPFGFIALLCVILLAASPFRTRRPRLWLLLTVIVGSAGLGIIWGSVTVMADRSVDSGVTAGVLVFTSVALVASGFLAVRTLVQRRRLQRANTLAQ